MKKNCFLLILLAVMLLTGCGRNSQSAPAAKPQAENVPEGFTAFTYPAGKYFEQETTWLRLPTAYKEEAGHKGTIEEVAYTTDVYGDGVTYEKHVLVYLPYGYNQDDKDTKYNVVYYEHGDGQNYKTVWQQEQFNQIDHMIENGDIPPVIIVFTTFYMVDGNQEIAGDGRSGSSLPNLFYREVTESILPVIETRYNTYLTGTAKEDFVATRDHRAFTGYSRGSAATWNMFHNAFEYFRFYAPMSNSVAPEQGKGWNSDSEMLAYLEEPVRANPGMPFFIYTCKGTAESIEKQTKLVELMMTSDCFTYGYDRETSNLAFTISNLNHSDRYVPYYYYSSLPLFFGK